MTTKRTPRVKTPAPVQGAEAPVVNRYKANPARGEVAELINGKHCLFVPSYQNIAVIEEETGESVLDIINQLSSGKVVVSKVVPILVNLNDGDPITYDEAFRWLASSVSDTAKQKALVNICYSVLDPEGNRFKAVTPEEAEGENPNG